MDTNVYLCAGALFWPYNLTYKHAREQLNHCYIEINQKSRIFFVFFSSNFVPHIFIVGITHIVVTLE